MMSEVSSLKSDVRCPRIRVSKGSWRKEDGATKEDEGRRRNSRDNGELFLLLTRATTSPSLGILRIKRGSVCLSSAVVCCVVLCERCVVLLLRMWRVPSFTVLYRPLEQYLGVVGVFGRAYSSLFASCSYSPLPATSEVHLNQYTPQSVSGHVLLDIGTFLYITLYKFSNMYIHVLHSYFVALLPWLNIILFYAIWKSKSIL